MSSTPSDRASARRAAARGLHPDVGGDAEQFAAALAAIDRRFGVRDELGPPAHIEIAVSRSRRGIAHSWLRTMTGLARQAGEHLPLRRRRYISL